MPRWSAWQTRAAAQQIGCRSLSSFPGLTKRRYCAPPTICRRHGMLRLQTPRTRQRLTRILIEEVVIDLDDKRNEAAVTIHWVGGRHTELRVARIRTRRYPED